MARILMLNIPAHGHVNPTIALVKELVRRGHEVAYLITGEFCAKIEAAGAKAICLDEATRSNLLFSIISFLSRARDVALRIGAAYDCIMYDMLFISGGSIGRVLNKPTIRLFSSFALNTTVLDRIVRSMGPASLIVKSRWVRSLATRLLVGSGNALGDDLLYEMMSGTADLNIVFMTRAFQLDSDSFDAEKYKFVGVSIVDRQSDINIPFEKMEGKIAYISMGTVFGHSRRFFRACIKAFAALNVNVIMSVGSKIDIGSLSPVPEKIHIYSFVPQLEVLKHADVFLTHGGMNSANEAMFYAVPLLVIPQTIDQPMVGMRVEQLQIGKMIRRKDVSIELLQKVVQELLSQSGYKENMVKLSLEMQKAGGYDQAATEIEMLLSEIPAI